MNEKSVAIKEALQFGWDTLKENVGFFLKVFVVLILMVGVPAMIVAKVTQSLSPAAGIPLKLLMAVWQAIISMGVLKICLKLYDRQSVEVADLWSCLPQTLDYVVVRILFGLIVGVGILLLVIPGILWAIQFYMASYLVVDRKIGAVAALKASSVMTKGVKWDLGIFASVVFLVNLAGVLCLGVGILITLPITMLANVYIYRKLLAQTEAFGQPVVK